MHRRGFTLIELLLVLVIGAILAGVAVPRVATWRDRLILTGEIGHTRALLDRARGAAIRLDQPVMVAESVGVVLVLTNFGTRQAVLAHHQLALGVSLSGLNRPIGFGPLGIGIGAANRTLVLRLGGAQRRLVLSRLGRIR